MQFFSLFLTVAFSFLVSASTFTNPLKEHAPDPSIVYVASEGYYYFVYTSTPIKLVRSRTLAGLKDGESKNVWSDTNPSRCCQFWAPEIHQIDGTWYLYYTAGNKAGKTHNSYVLKGGASPWDTYTFLSQLTTGGGIDGSTIHFPNLGHHFLWSCNRASALTPNKPFVPERQAICIAPLLTPGKLGKTGVISAPTQPWERHGFPVNEGPHAMYHGNKTYIAYSASFCGTQFYSLGLLTWTGEDPLSASSWVKSRGPVLSSANGNLGTGHNGFFRSPDGTQIWNVFHAENKFPNGQCGQARYTMAERVFFDEETGTPIFQKAQRLGKEQEAPSGEREDGKNCGLVKNPEPPQN